jgi:biotin transport system substrate-specific component
MNDLARLTLAGFAGVITIQLCGILNLLLGPVLSRWNESLPDLLFSYSLGPLLAQLTLCVAIALIALPIRRLLWIE